MSGVRVENSRPLDGHQRWFHPINVSQKWVLILGCISMRIYILIGTWPMAKQGIIQYAKQDECLVNKYPNIGVRSPAPFMYARSGMTLKQWGVIFGKQTIRLYKQKAIILVNIWAYTMVHATQAFIIYMNMQKSHYFTVLFKTSCSPGFAHMEFNSKPSVTNILMRRILKVAYGPC